MEKKSKPIIILRGGIGSGATKAAVEELQGK